LLIGVILLEETDKQQKKIKKRLQEFHVPHIFISVNATPLQTGSLTATSPQNDPLK
jgi:hypothetical protein